MVSMAQRVEATREEVERSMRTWGLQRDMYAQAKQWHETVANEGYFATAIKIPWQREGVKGMLLAVSTALSTRVSAEKKAVNNVGGIITNPEWLYYEVWWYPGLALLNWSGITDTTYQGTELGMLLGDVLNVVCISRGMTDWKERFCCIRGGFFRESLRQLLVSIGIQNWLEITSGFSWRGYAALDLYIRVFSGGMDPPDEEAWYLLNTELAP